MQSESKSSTVWYVAAAGATVAAAAGVWYALRQRKKKDVPADGFKLVACDMDGTLLDANHKISPRNVC